MTIGTPSDDPRAEHPDLIPLHNYAVLSEFVRYSFVSLLTSFTDFQEHDGIREVEIINPWNSADDERGWCSFSRCDYVDSIYSVVTTLVAWDSISAYFSALYVNWNPAIFSHSTAIHR